jgi:hypothetical protein
MLEAEMRLFQDASAWQVFASGQAEGRVESTQGAEGGSALRLQYDFHGGNGFIALRRAIPLHIPATFHMHLQYRGDGPANDLECKVCSAGGANVWRNQFRQASLTSTWKTWSFTERDLRFAWGPAGGGAPDQIEAIEIVIVAGPGGRGHLDLCDFQLIDETLIHPAAILTSSHREVFSAADGHPVPAHGWQASADDAHPWWSMDFGRMHRFGGAIIEWPADLPPRAFLMEISRDSRIWQTIYQARCAEGDRTFIPTPMAEARYLRLRFEQAATAALREVHLQSDAFSQTPNEFLHAVAQHFPRGWHPRYWHREQTYWTTIGLPEGGKRALINEEGMIEVDEGGFSLEPFLMTDEGLFTWSEMPSTLGLVADDLPMPIATMTHGDTSCQITPWMEETATQRILLVRYRWHMARPGPNRKFALAVRPFQVTPPWQAFRNIGGVSPIEKIDSTGERMLIEEMSVSVSPAADEQGAAMMEQGGVVAYLSRGACPPRQKINDTSKLASAAWIWHIPDHASEWEVVVSVPYGQAIVDNVDAEITVATRHWHEVLDAVKWSVPDCAKAAFDCWKTCAGHILINREGEAFQPGARRYTRSWIRDGVIMGAALAKTGIAQPLQSFIEWYAAFQREDGFVPCVVDRDGIDWLVEHDSHGQLIWGIREAYRYQKDEAFLSRMLPHARMAATHLLSLRHQNQSNTDSKKTTHGLLPESASHEGYLAHPVHSYWDDFWGIRGMEACAEICAWAGQHDEAAHWRNEAGLFCRDVIQSMQRVIDQGQLPYLPGSVEWADFDPTASANAIGLLDFADELPAVSLQSTLSTYLEGMHRRQSGETPSQNYSAYEIRIIAALVRVGRREEANHLLSFFLSERRPLAWNQWPEITWRDPRSPAHLGDLPHTWIAAEYILALSQMIASERESKEQLILAPGVPWSWVSEQEGLRVQNWPTRFGQLEMTLYSREERELWIEIGDDLSIPTDGIILSPPYPPDMQYESVEVIQGLCQIDRELSQLHVRKLPLRARLFFQPRFSADQPSVMIT